MNVDHEQAGCGKVRGYLESYISNELLVETNHEVLHHLENCTACAAELETLTRIRARLKTAVQNQTVPPELQVRIRERLRTQPARTVFTVEWARWAVTAAAVLVLSVGAWFTVPGTRLPALSDRRAQDAFIQKVSERVGAVLRVGLGDHIHCTVFRKYEKNPPPLDQLAAGIGPKYSQLVLLVRAKVPGQYRIIMAHQCGYKGRRFIHVALQNGSNLMSLVIATKQDGESLNDLQESLRPSGIPVYQSAARKFEIAAFETDRYLAFIVSDLGDRKNLEVAAELAPAVHEFLSKQQG